VLAADQLHQAVAREQAALDELRTPDDVEPQVTT
jgi:hypothetical protein